VACPVVAVAALGAEDRFVSAFQLGCIRDRRQFSRGCLAASQRLRKFRVDPRYLKTLANQLEQCNETA
jgi:hypothetical protein